MDEPNAPTIPQISVIDVKAAMDNHKKFILSDVRFPAELLGGKLPGAINLPLPEVELKITTIIPDKNSTIYVYCLSASRSVFAVDTMIKLGYTNVLNITSGVLAWRYKGYPME